MLVIAHVLLFSGYLNIRCKLDEWGAVSLHPPLGTPWAHYNIAITAAKKTMSIMNSIRSISCLITPLNKFPTRVPYPNITCAMITVPIAFNSKYVSNSICRSSRIVVQALTIEPRLWLLFLTLLTPLLAIMFFSPIHKNITSIREYINISNITFSPSNFLNWLNWEKHIER